MIVLPPINFFSEMAGGTAQVTFSGFSDATVNWSPVTTYNLNDIVKGNRRKYKSLIASNHANVLPIADGSSNAFWQDVGPTNEAQMLDYTSNTQSIADANTGNITINVQSHRVDTIGIANMDADTVRLRVTNVNGGTTVYDKTEKLYSRTVEDWYDYFYKSFRFRTAALFENLPGNLNNYYDVDFATGSRVVKVGNFIAGQSVYLGETQYDPTISTINYSTVTADTFGNTVLIPRRSVPNNTVTTQIPAINVDDALAVKGQLNAAAALWSGLDDDTQPYFGSLLTLGVYTQFDIDPFSIDYATVTLQLQGL